ncbi:DUF4272 domain-containing protein [bacterium]|nr:DUF4272 domain-containing protein [bacterium]
MSGVSIIIYSHRIDPAGVARLVSELAPHATQVGENDNWTKISVVTRKKSLLRKQQALILVHDDQYYDGPGWQKHRLEFATYLSEFPASRIKPDIIRLIHTFRFALSVPCEGLSIDDQGERMRILKAVCKHLDGVMFVPWSLRDAEGRVLLDTSRQPHPQAVIPKMPPRSPVLESDGDLDDEPEPPTAERVARRTLALAAIATRATMELDFGNNDTGFYEKHAELLEWVAGLDIDDEFEPQEWKVLQRPVGKLEEQDFINAMWRVEGLAVLAWALQLHPLPAYDELVTPMELYAAIGVFEADAGSRLVENAKLAGVEELNKMRDHMLAFHWRVTDFRIRPEPMDFVEFSKECWFGSFSLEWFNIVDGDLAFDGAAIVNIGEDRFGIVRSTARERHLAINWLRGGSRIYSQTGTDT